MPNYPVVELDFDLIKDSLKEYLRSQSEFKDFDFEGSGINIILDILAKNTHFNAFMANMMANEMFIDSAEVRQSVVSKAKELGYTPRSVRASQAVINLVLNNVPDVPPEPGLPAEPPAYVEIPAGIQFTNNAGFIFSTSEPHLLYPTGVSGQYGKEDIDIYDGRLIEFQYIVDDGNPDQRFIIPDVDVDTSTLLVTVKENEESIIQAIYTLNEDINKLNSNSEVYFLHETAEGYFEITFGDGIIGKSLGNGNAVILNYIVAGEKGNANGIETFRAYQRINNQGGEDIRISTTVKSFNGSEKETIEKIKFHALRFFQSQKRAVTTGDYENFIIRDYPFIESINTWGGEYNDPPTYGKIFIAIKPKHTEFLSKTLKEKIKTDLIKKYNVVTVIPEIIDPDYIYVLINSDVYYIRSKTTQTVPALISLIGGKILNYFLETTRKFKMDFRFSPMIKTIDASNKAITSSLTDIMVSKRVYPIVGATQTFTTRFSNELIPNTIFTSYFNTENEEVSGEPLKTGIKDDGNGVLYAFNVVTGNVINQNIGSVNYSDGIISFTIHTYGLPPDALDLRIYATPKLKNITPGNNQIIVPDTSAYNGEYNRLQGISVKMLLTKTEVA